MQRTAPLAMIVALFQLAWLAPSASMAQEEPTGPHPRLFLDGPTEANLRKLADSRGTVVAAAVGRCRDLESSPDTFARDGYMGLDWAQHLQDCLIAWKATGREGAARTAARFFRALLDDLQVVGDGKGGDGAARRDSGYAIRAHGPYAALAYDWLHDAPGIDADLLARARSRFKAWTDWYAAQGYRARSPGTNYHAGYFFAATLIAVAQAGEAGDDGARLWRQVTDTLFARDLMPSMTHGVLRGGDWGEGWQYGPLSVAEYALAARAVAPFGVATEPVGPWLDEVLRRHVHALTPAGDRTYAAGDTQVAEANLPVRRETLAAVVAGPASQESRRWAMSELDRLGLMNAQPDFSLFAALAEARLAAAEPFPREQSPLTYLAQGTSILYARSSWSRQAVWFVTPCSATIDVDHVHPNAGSFVLSRGGDDLIVDPSPYGTLSSLTSNAPTVISENLPDEYLPSQAFWGRETGFRWIRSLGQGVLLARCDYADQYRIQQTPSDVPVAYRDFVLVPYRDDEDAESAFIFVLDRSRGRTPRQGLRLRFRSLAELGLETTVAGGRMGRSSVAIRRLMASDGTLTLQHPPVGDCFSSRFTRGNCDAARFPVSEVSTELKGPEANAAFLIEAGSRRARAMDPVTLPASDGWAWGIHRGQRSWFVVVPGGAGVVSYDAPASPAVHFFLPFAARGGGTLRVGASQGDAGCHVVIGAETGVEIDGSPPVFALDSQCNVSPL